MTETNTIEKNITIKNETARESAFYNIVEKPTKTFGNAINGGVQFILYPLLRFNIFVEQHLENYAAEQRKKIENIPEENRIEPPMNILMPALESLKYCIDQEQLRNMFSTLLANSMDSTKKDIAHPSFVDVIRQLNTSDAEFINEIKYGFDFYYSVVEYREILKGGKTFRVLLTNVSDAESDILLLNTNSISNTNLSRLGLIKIDFSNKHDMEDYSIFDTEEIRMSLKPLQDDPDNEIEIKHGILSITPYGKLFINCCL